MIELSGRRRQEKRAEKREFRKEKHHEKHEGHLIKLRGKNAVKSAKFKKKVNVQGAKEGKRVGTNLLKLKKRVQRAEPKESGKISTPDDGVMPGAGGGGGGGGNFSPGEEQQEDFNYDEFELMPEEVEGEEQGEEPVYEYEEQGNPYGGEMNDLGGFWGTAFTAAKGAVKGAVQQVKQQTKGAVQNQINPSAALMKENEALKNELQAYKDSQPLKLAGTALASSLTGFMIAKLLK